MTCPLVLNLKNALSTVASWSLDLFSFTKKVSGTQNRSLTSSVTIIFSRLAVLGSRLSLSSRQCWRKNALIVKSYWVEIVYQSVCMHQLNWQLDISHHILCWHGLHRVDKHGNLDINRFPWKRNVLIVFFLVGWIVVLFPFLPPKFGRTLLS